MATDQDHSQCSFDQVRGVQRRGGGSIHTAGAPDCLLEDESSRLELPLPLSNAGSVQQWPCSPVAEALLPMDSPLSSPRKVSSPHLRHHRALR